MNALATIASGYVGLGIIVGWTSRLHLMLAASDADRMIGRLARQPLKREALP